MVLLDYDKIVVDSSLLWHNFILIIQAFRIFHGNTERDGKRDRNYFMALWNSEKN